MSLAPEPQPLLRVHNLDAFYGRAQAAFGVGFELAPGSVTALLGRNGAGKSTILKALVGQLVRRVQHLDFAGANAAAWPPYRLARAGLGYVPEDRRIFTDLTVAENLEVGRQPPRAGAPHWTPERLFELFPNLADMRQRSAGAMSGGEQQMLTLARTLMGNPRLLLLDEPSEGLAPRIVTLMAQAIVALQAEGLAILLAEQNLRFAGHVSQRAIVVAQGQVRFDGPMAELLASARLRQQLLAV